METTRSSFTRRGVEHQIGRRAGRPPHRGDLATPQGSGKSLTMAFYAGRIIRELAMANPTVVVLTDRNDLDDQLFGTFSRCQELLRQPPVQAESRVDLRDKLSVESGGVVFHHHPEVSSLTRKAPGRQATAATQTLSETPQHRGHRRRGTSEPV